MADKTWIGGSTAGANSANVAANWSPSGVPTGSDNIFFTHLSTSSLLHDLTTLSTVNGELHIRNSYTKFIGSSTGPHYFEMKPSVAYLDCVQPTFVDVKASTGVLNISNTGSGTFSSAGLNLKGSAIGRINLTDGHVAIALGPGETSTVAEIEMLSRGKLLLGSGVTWTHASMYGGTLTATAGTTNSVVNMYGGTFSGSKDAKLKALNVFDGTAFWGGNHGIRDVTIEGGAVTTVFSGQARTVTNLRIHSGTFIYDPNVLTITNFLHTDKPVQFTVSEA